MKLVICLLALVFLACPAHSVFTDITQDCGLGSVGGTKLAWGDYNNDGYEDLLVQGKRLFRNNGPPDWNFTEVTDSAGIGGSASCGGVWGDYDNDGWLDIYANCCGYSSDILWRNNGDETFTDVTLAAGNPSDTFPSEGVAWGDYDNDGYIDIYVANYENWDLGISYPDFLWHNLGDGTFSNCTDSAGVNENLRSRGVCWGDYDENSYSDVYVSNYRLMPNHLWGNKGNGTFLQEAFNEGVAGTEFGGYYGHTIGSAWGDLNNDGYLDLFAANLAHKDPARGPYCDDSYIFINNGPPDYDFTDIRETSGIEIHPVGSTRDGYYWDELHDGVALGDYDNDGDMDICVTQVYDIPFAWSFLWTNNGDGTFTDVTEIEGVRVWNGWAPAWCDFDRDGDLDLAEYGSDTYPIGSRIVRLYRNEGNDNNWFEIVLNGDDCNKAAIGAIARLYYPGGQQMRQVEGGTGNSCQNSLALEFGLGTHQSIDSVQIIWPCGRVEVANNLAHNLYMTRTETGPWITQRSVSPYHVSPQDTVLITARAFDDGGAASVWADIQKPDESVVDSVEMFDDGMHGDGAAGDSTFGVYYQTQPTGGTFVVDVKASDGTYVTEIDNIGYFTSLGPVQFYSSRVSEVDTVPSPGDTFHVMISLQNMGNETVYGVSASLSSLDPEASVLNSEGFFGDISPLDTVSSSEFQMSLTLFCPHAEQIQLELYISDSLKPTATWKDTFSIVCVDDEPPRLISPRSIPWYLTEGDTVTIIGRISEGSGLNTATATIENPVGTPIATIDLYDDGMHGDSLAGDGLYGNMWETPPWEQAFYNVNISLEDGQSNAVEHINLMEFTTVPYSKSATILLVDDDNYNHPQMGSSKFYEDYYEEALSAGGYPYDYWDVFCYGSPDTGVLNQYDIIIWETGTTSDSFNWFNDWDRSSSLSSYEQDNLKAYLANRGRLFISSQGIVDFWQGPLRTMLRIQDLDFDVGKDSVAGVPSNPIGDGLSFVISGGLGADNQYAQSAMSPMVLGQPVFDYKDYSNGNAAIMCQVAGMWAAVTFGFGFEAIADEAARDTIMNRIINWLQSAVASEEELASKLPRRLELSQPGPNPCDGPVTFAFGLPTRTKVRLSIYNCAGQRIKTLLDGYREAGYETVIWDCSDSQGKLVANGTYFCRIDAGRQRKTRKLVLMR
ncbi:hypothetical protein E3J62_04520 [candidate division TA06 bacterium]|uniref:T9SS type A sorting domain-containing protein n=1 Tax=candidate division TA06 bacterium TaxID=2250710 RepID=A0A523UVG8_UNCT6|nr:MAG: hypothetical protein E3J62_04520 [candidate division TA06 bacterium]